jgi:hypothetical protein
MFYSSQNKLLFIAAPKTGSTSVEACLSELIQDGTRFRIDLSDRTITSAHVKTPSLGHAKASEFRDVLGSELYQQLKVFGFVRDPIEKVVSSYFFTRNGKLSESFSIRTQKFKAVMVTRRIISIISARLLPLWLWSLIYRMRDCNSYFTDGNGNIIVHYLGATNRLSTDLVEILDHLGHQVPEELIPHSNASSHRNAEDYWFFRLWIPYLRRRYSGDLRLFNLVEDGVWVNSERISDSHVGVGIASESA